MAGICAYIVHSGHGPPARTLLEQTVGSMYPLSGAKYIAVPLSEGGTALGGMFPRHLQRKTVYVSSGGRTLLFYGEVYDLPPRKAEAEFALELFAKEGPAGLSRLNGPFAFVCWDGPTRTLTVGTDRFGRVPLFFFSYDGTIGVTSDLHAALAAGIFPAQLCRESIIDMLTIGFCVGEKSMFEGVKRISGGEYCTITDGRITKGRYWNLERISGQADVGQLANALEFCAKRAVSRWSRPIVALSGGWDSRATWAALKGSRHLAKAMTFGEYGSTDLTIASAVARSLEVPHIIIEPSERFFRSFPELAHRSIALGNGHLLIDYAFQLFIFEELAEDFDMLLDSAGCEFRRGIRAKIAAKKGSGTSEVPAYVASLYSTGIWSLDYIDRSFYFDNTGPTTERLAAWGEHDSTDSFYDAVDTFSWAERWGHYYAHGYSLQTNIIGGHLPYYDHEFYDLYLRAARSVRWSHEFQRSVIHRYAPELREIPLSYGGCKTRHGDDLLRYGPILYHKVISGISSLPLAHWLKNIDNYKPFLPFHRWYVRELADYVQDMIYGARLRASGILNIDGVTRLLERQNSTYVDLSSQLHVLLTLAHLLEYVQELKFVRTVHSR